MSDEHGLPYVEVPAKRTAEKVAIDFDWHDYLSNIRIPGRFYGQGTRIRFERERSTGYEYEATVAGFTSGVPNDDENFQQFPSVLGETVTDGSVTWTTRAMSTASIRATIVTSVFEPVAGLTLSNQSEDDMVHTIHALGGTDRSAYLIPNTVTLSNPPGEVAQRVARLPVYD